MGKYIRKTKINAEVALMEVTQQPSLGIRTRARALAQQRLQKDQHEPSYPRPDYLQLRSRRLEKTLPQPTRDSGSRVRESADRSCRNEAAAQEVDDDGVQGSFGENVIYSEPAERNERETTPCSMIRSSKTIGTPGSTTRPAKSIGRIQSSVRCSIPAPHEMEEFFARAEQVQLNMFVEKYNFDLATDLPLPGRYEWVKLDL